MYLEDVTTWQASNQGYAQRFTGQARKAWSLAQEEARRRQDGYIGGHHLLLGLVGEGSGVAALVLAQIAPSRAPDLLQRATDYAQSRLVCGVHFPSDTEAGRALAVAVVERLRFVKAFRHDLLCAQVEIARTKKRRGCQLPKGFVPR